MLYFIPPIGIKGFYELSAPLDNLIFQNELYVCKSLRKISDYVHNNEDVKELIYTKYGIPEVNYIEDLKEDIIIASLQNDVGHWLNIPVRYFVKYPDLSGIAYKSFAIGVSLPSFPINKNFNPLVLAINNLVEDMLGITPEIKIIETSREILVPDAQHISTENDRKSRITSGASDRTKYLQLLSVFQEVQQKLSAAEQFIINLIS